MYLLLTRFTKIIRNETLHVQCTTHNALIPFYKLKAGLNLNIPVNKREYFRLADFSGHSVEVGKRPP
jgi:hypothetical protein